MPGSGRSFGINCASSINDVQERLPNGFSFIHCSIVDSKFTAASADSDSSFLQLIRSDLKSPSTDWNSVVVEAISCNSDTSNEDQQLSNGVLLEKELLTCIHFCVSSVTVSLQTNCNVNIACVVLSVLGCNLSGIEVWGHVPLKKSVTTSALTDAESGVSYSAWNVWKKFHCLTGFHPNVGVVLELTAELPVMIELDRWLSEPLKGLIIPTSIFGINARGFPVLSVAHQLFIGKIASLCTRVIITGPALCKTLSEYVTYLNYLFDSAEEPVGYDFEYLLKATLQPLVDQFCVSQYEFFENDCEKYAFYQQAIYEALCDRKKINDQLQVIAVLGANRGSLVLAVLKAASMAEIQVRVYAVERNGFACTSFKMESISESNNSVIVCNQNILDWTSPEPCDIIVSEVLGSFGDHELFPECLATSRKWLKEDGISIPFKFTTYVRPTQSSKLCQLIQDNGLKDCQRKAYETPYLYNDSNVLHLAPEKPILVFEFPCCHGSFNSMYSNCHFKIQQSCSLTGFTAYFETNLYKNVVISSLPTPNNGDFSRLWPMFFPLQKEVILKEGDDLTFSIWRLSEKNRVWYEWAVSEPSQTRIHNVCGRSSFYSLP